MTKAEDKEAIVKEISFLMGIVAKLSDNAASVDWNSTANHLDDAYQALLAARSTITYIESVTDE